MAAQANYGGSVTNIRDRRTITTILDDFYNIEVVNIEKYGLCGSESDIVSSSETHNKKDDLLN